MPFWSKKEPLEQSSENRWRDLDPAAFDKGEKINRRAAELVSLAESGDMNASDVIVALQTALGNEIAATTFRRNPKFSPDQHQHVIDQLLDGVGPGVREAAYLAADFSTKPSDDDGRDLTEEEFQALTIRIVNEATKNNTPVNDALTATAKAVGVLISSILAERTDISAEDLINYCQSAVDQFARNALEFRTSQNSRL